MTDKTTPKTDAKAKKAGPIPARFVGMGCLFFACFLGFILIWQFWDKIAIPFMQNFWYGRIMPIVYHLQANAVMYIAGLVFAAVCTFLFWRRFVSPKPKSDSGKSKSD